MLRIDPGTDRVRDRIPVGVGLLRLAAGERAIWAIRGFAGIDELVRIDP